jgi:predicted RNA-binding protein with RPS1 domain
MCDKLDPVIKEEFEKTETESILNAVSLLKWHVEKGKEFSIAFQLAMPQTTHSHVIDIDEAKTIWLPIENWEKSDTFKIYKKRVKELCRKQDKTWHTIESFLPLKKETKNVTTTKTKPDKPENNNTTTKKQW